MIPSQSVFHVSYLRGLFGEKSFKAVDMDNLEGAHLSDDAPASAWSCSMQCLHVEMYTFRRCMHATWSHPSLNCLA